MGLRLAIIGDVHGFWNTFDVEYFNQAGYDRLIFVGDLAPFTNAVPTARSIANLRVPAMVIPGNHDGVNAAQFVAELHGRARLADLLAAGAERKYRRLDTALGPVNLIGFSLHRLSCDESEIGLIAGRPHSMGGNRFYFHGNLRQRYGIADWQASADRLRALVDQAPRDIIFVAHNGPAGVGDRPEDPWGCDFRPENGDFGDPDLAQAITHARDTGHRVLAVAAGHMHRRMKRSRGRRRAAARLDDVLYINAAEVPRIRKPQDGPPQHHHVALETRNGEVHATDMWVDESGPVCSEPLG